MEEKEEIKNWDIISVGKLYREIAQGKYSERELATKIYEQNNELRNIKTLLDKYNVDPDVPCKLLDTYEACVMLNEQDKRIKELEQENQQLKQKVNDWKQRFESSEERLKIFNNNGVTALNLKNEKIEKLKQQLHELPKKIMEEIRDCLLDTTNGWWRYFMTNGCEYMLSSDLQGCLDETIDTILKKYGESNNE